MGIVFKQFKLMGRQFIEIQREGNIHVVADNGDNYGAWRKRETFIRSYRACSSGLVVGQCRLEIGIVDNVLA